MINDPRDLAASWRRGWKTDSLSHQLRTSRTLLVCYSQLAGWTLLPIPIDDNDADCTGEYDPSSTPRQKSMTGSIILFSWARISRWLVRLPTTFSGYSERAEALSRLETRVSAARS